MKKTITIFILFVLSLHYAFCEKIANPSERYANVYKNYQNASLTIPDDKIKNYVYFARDREALKNHAFLNHHRFDGAQIMYSWAQLEPNLGDYDFSLIKEDFDYLSKHGKKLFVQLQDATFDTAYKGVPQYLLSSEYDGGVVYQRSDNGKPEGWVAKRWNQKVSQRFEALLMALGAEFDGRIEGVNLQETAIGVFKKDDKTFSPVIYVNAIKRNMKALKKAFPKSVRIQYANFMPDEWLPWDDKGYLRDIYKYGNEIGVGLGAPDLMVQKKGQLNHALAMMHENKFSVPLAIAVQDGNYIGQTNSNKVMKKRANMVPMLYAFAKDFLKVDYIFWSHQEPYFKEDVLPSFSLSK